MYLQILAVIFLFVLCCIVLWCVGAALTFERNLKTLDKIEDYNIYSVIPPTYNMDNYISDEVSEDDITQPFIRLPTLEIKSKHEA
jgi:hypothetical protein